MTFVNAVVVKNSRKGDTIVPDFNSYNFDDFMIRGNDFYAIWDEDSGMWSTNPALVGPMVDKKLYAKQAELEEAGFAKIPVMSMLSFNSGSRRLYKNYLRTSDDNFHPLDENITFQNTVVKKEDYVSKRLPYEIKPGPKPAYERLISTLYSPTEREKIEWAVGSIIAGESKKIQKFLVFYGDAGTGKSTILDIIAKMFEGYVATFDAKSLGSNDSQFATEAFRTNPLVAIQHDGDLSRIADNTKLNSIVSHETILINEKYKSAYPMRINSFLFMGSNKPVDITDSKSGLIRRLIDVRPTGVTIPPDDYYQLVDQVKFELGAIADHCLEVYKRLGRSYYSGYKPRTMIEKTNFIYNYVSDYSFIFERTNEEDLKDAYVRYTEYCSENHIDRILPRYKFRDEFGAYWDECVEIPNPRSRGKTIMFRGFKRDKFESKATAPADTKVWINLDKTTSSLDGILADCPAQYANTDEIPSSKWSGVKTTLKDLDTSKLHYVKVPLNHIVIDFDLKDADGNKSRELNLEAANKWPPTYAELSKGGNGVHLHYIYDGDPMELSRVYDDGIEVKVFNGDSALRRRVSLCNDLPLFHISSGLRKKVEKTVNATAVKTEKHLRALIEKNLRKEIHSSTKSSVDFILKILDDAYNSDLKYDVTDLRSAVLAFAMNSTNNADWCVKAVNKMQFKSQEEIPPDVDPKEDDRRIVFFDCEVFPNLFIINWKYDGAPPPCIRMINPTPEEVGELFKMKLVAFNNRRYDNHILYARYLGYTNEELYELSQKIVNSKDKTANYFFANAYNISYTDVYDFASAGNKKSLKKWEVELGIHHQELGFPWDKPVPENKWNEVAAYCDNDVLALEAVFHHLAGDWAARQILAELSGLPVNATTNQHSTRIIFGTNKTPQNEFNYRDLSLDFPGYKFENGKSYYRDEIVGEGGYVYAEPGMYTNVALLDVASMHPSSIEALNLFGDRYTRVFSDIKKGRLAFKHRDKALLDGLLGGKLDQFFDKASNGEYSFKDVANALKTVINSVYGLTAAKFPNPFKDPRNIDNIVAKRGALFMVNLKHEVQDQGFTVAHIKTDSIKIPNATPEIIEFVMEYGKKYGYTFEHEATYSKICLVNDAVYIAQYPDGKWTATGAQFAQPYVFKTLFSHEPIEFADKCEVRSISKGKMYLDMNESLPESEHNYKFIGSNGLFCPVKPGSGGGELFREQDDKYYAISGTKGYRWLEAEDIIASDMQSCVDESYYVELVDQAVEDISKYGDFEWFVGETENLKGVA